MTIEGKWRLKCFSFIYDHFQNYVARDTWNEHENSYFQSAKRIHSRENISHAIASMTLYYY